MNALRLHPGTLALFTILWTAAFAALPAGVLRAASTPGAPVLVNTNATFDLGSDFVPSIAAAAPDRAVVVWHSYDSLSGAIGPDRDILFSRTTDGGATWSGVFPLNLNADQDSGSDVWPCVAREGNTLITAWSSNDTLGGTIGADFDILFSRSTDEGATWSPPAALNSNAPADSGDDGGDAGGPWLRSGRGGRWLCVWDSTDSLGGSIGADRDILYSISLDDGLAWTAPAPLNSHAAADSSPDLRPRAATDGQGNWIAVWHSDANPGGALGTDREVLFAQSSDHGLTWTPSRALNVNALNDRARDEEPFIGRGGGRWLAAWWSGGESRPTGADADIFAARMDDGATTWTEPKALNANAASDLEADLAPVLVHGGGDYWLAAWHSTTKLGAETGSDSDILYAYSFDGGGGWSAPAHFNTNGGTDSGQDFYAALAVIGTDDFIGTWQTTNTAAGAAGSDSDIASARFKPSSQFPALRNHLLGTAPAAPEMDVNGDGRIDTADLLLVLIFGL